MEYTIRNARLVDSVQIGRMLRESLKQGVEGKFSISSRRLLDHVQATIWSADGFAIVLLCDDEIVGCFLAECIPHAYCNGNIVRELGVYINNEHRGNMNFEKLLREFDQWSGTRPDVLLTTFTIGQLGATTPYLRAVLKKFGFTQGDEGYYKT